MLFAKYVELLPGEGVSAVTAQAEDLQQKPYVLDVEYVGKVPGFEWLTQIIVPLPNQLANVGDVLVSITVHGVTSNKVLLTIKQSSIPTPTPTPTPPTSLPAMTFPGAKWETRDPQELGVDSAKMEAAFAYLSQHLNTSTTAVIRNGYLIRSGSGIDTRFSAFSVTKSFTSTVLGLLIDDGKASLNTRAMDHVPVMANLYPTVNLRHFTTMTSGYDAPGESYEPPDGSPDPFVPGTPLFTPPGSQYAYFDDAMGQFGHVLTRIAQESVYDLFKRRIADPIGMTNWQWAMSAVLDGYYVYDTSGNQTGITISPRELARFGHLFLNRGNWNGNQLLSTGWVDQATAVQVPASTPHSGIRPGFDGRGVYGFNWWVNGIKPNGERKWPSAPVKTFAAWGINENRVWVVPEWGMVVIRVSNSGDVSDTVWDGFFARLKEAIVVQ